MTEQAKSDMQRMAEMEATLKALSKSQGVMEFATDGTIRQVNDYFLSALGYELSELQGQHHRTLIDDAHAQSDAYQAFWTALSRGEFQAAEYRWAAKDGKDLWLQATYNPITDHNGQVYKVVLMAADITANKNKLAFDLAEFNTRIAIMNKTSLISESDLKGNILDINEKFSEVSQFSRDEVLGKPHSIVRHPDSPKELFKELWSTIGRGGIFRSIIKNRKKDGTPYYVDAVIAPVLGKNGKPRKYIGVRYDITEAELDRQNIRGILSAVDASFIYAEFDTSGFVITVNQNFLQAMGYQKQDQVVGKHHRVLVDSGEVNTPGYAQFWEDLKDGKRQNNLVKRIAADGRQLWFQAVYSPVVNEKGEVRKVVKVAIDVTDQVAAKVRLQNAIDEVLSVVSAAAGGDLTHEITVTGDDAIGQVGVGLRRFFQDLRKKIAKIIDGTNSLAAISEEMAQTSAQMSSNSEETSVQANVVSVAAEQVNSNLQLMVVSTEELSASIREIASNTNVAAQVSQSAVKLAISSNETVSKLGVSSAEISAVVKVIHSIAQQTNLLALNAAIEAARAGDAGRGFAVVANEVKELARRTAQATDDIERKIGSIQQDTRGAITTIQEIAKIINQLGDISGVIATAVGEQAATTNEIGRNVNDAAKGAADIARNIAGVATAASGTLDAANQSMVASSEVSKMASMLQELMDMFKI